MSTNADKECTRCGTCCAKGGPALHRDDLDLLERGVFGLKDLMTLRKGELVTDLSGALVPLEQEIIKLRGRSETTWTCCFFNVVDRLCFIYGDRPAECRVLDCWDTDPLKAMHDKERITRADVLADNEELLQLVAVHEQKCDYFTLAELASRLDDDAEAREAFLEAVRFDIAFRNVVQEKARIPENQLIFLFGRPMAETVHMFGLEIIASEHGPDVRRKTGKDGERQAV